MKKYGKIQILAWILAIMPILVTGAMYSRLPDKIPMHWDFDGTVSYDDKWQLLILTLLPLGFAVMFHLLPRLDPRRTSYDKFRDGYELFQVAMMLFILLLIVMIIVESMRPGMVNIPTVMCIVCSIMFIVIGNMMPKFRQNFFFGIKNPWTLSSETVWTRTHRLGGWMMFGAGLFGLAGAFMPSDGAKVLMMFVPIMVACIVPTVYSYIWFRQESRGTRGEKDDRYT